MKNKKKYKLIVYKKGTIYSDTISGLIWKIITKNYDRKYENRNRGRKV